VARASKGSTTTKHNAKSIDMQESKNAETQEKSEDSAREADLHPNGSSAKDGWGQYRRWISKARAPRKRRGGTDPSLYTLDRFRIWTEQVKRNWSEE